MFCETFPVTPDREENPAILLFGNRLFNDQSATELLVELLLVINSRKRIGKTGAPLASPLPEVKALLDWPHDEKLHYAPKARLNLKLFAFMGASRLDSRHQTHREHYKELLEKLQATIRVAEIGSENEALRTLGNLFLGFQGAGSGRTWCAQSFLPICPGLLAGETIWSESVARRTAPTDWSDLMLDKSDCFASNKHLFLARGGELLYLQLCNALRQKPATIKRWIEESDVSIEPTEQDPVRLHAELQRALTRLLDQCPRTVSELADFVDSGVDPDTSGKTDTDADGDPRYVTAEWCAEESWQEGYLFAVDLLRLCTADLDVIERLLLLEAACGMQVLRSLAAQSARHSSSEREVTWPGYRLAVSAPDEDNSAVKRISRHTAKVAEKLIYHAIRSVDVALPERDKLLREADRRYGGKLFTGMAKRIGLLVPRRGAAVRFTLNERLLRLLVVTTVPVGGRLTYDRFKLLVESRHGLVFDTDGFARASKWADGIERIFLGNSIDTWLQDMLAAAGLLIHLSDACALVVNPAAKRGVES